MKFKSTVAAALLAALTLSGCTQAEVDAFRKGWEQGEKEQAEYRKAHPRIHCYHAYVGDASSDLYCEPD